MHTCYLPVEEVDVEVLVVDVDFVVDVVELKDGDQSLSNMSLNT